MYKRKQCLVALVCVLAAAAGDAKARLTHASKLRTRRNAQKGNPLRTPPGEAKDCAGNNPTLPRAAERFKTRLAAATAGCQVVVYTTLFYPPGIRLPHPSTRLGPAAYNGSAGECYTIVAGAASAASLREHCDVSPWRIVEMGGVHGRRASRRPTLRHAPERGSAPRPERRRALHALLGMLAGRVQRQVRRRPAEGGRGVRDAPRSGPARRPAAEVAPLALGH